MNIQNKLNWFYSSNMYFKIQKKWMPSTFSNIEVCLQVELFEL